MRIRKLSDLEGIGKAMLADFHLLGVRTVEELAACNPDELYEVLADRTGQPQDVCVLDVFRCAVAQARDPQLPSDQRKWWYWARMRKAGPPGSVSI